MIVIGMFNYGDSANVVSSYEDERRLGCEDDVTQILVYLY